jgi:hypothetical protein
VAHDERLRGGRDVRFWKSAPDLRIQDRVKRPSGDHGLAIYREFGEPIVNLRIGDFTAKCLSDVTYDLTPATHEWAEISVSS